IGTPLAKRYPPDVGIFAAVAAPSEAAVHDLNQIVAKGEALMVQGLNLPADLPDWSIVYELHVSRMICHQPVIEVESVEQVVDLTSADVADMLHLIEGTQPGPFLPRTIEMGRYIGIRKDGQLVAMAGERFYPLGYHEISAVCTHPDHWGKGYARLLVSRVAARQQREGDIPFLHVDPHNARAIAIYEQLGFRKNAEGSGFIVQR
ncbi:MAG TPA: GNAT family N-acetyltransferase, partial [Phototrophicaceae bacterium]|nr:GNAT family N-acetyltransferase [Phototrophicaceae bacterium]